MNLAWNVLLGMLVVACSAMATYLISISRERLWLRSKKAEELYHKAEEVCYELSYFFRERYDLSLGIVYARKGGEISNLNRQVVDLKILVGLYFPSIDVNLSAAVAATATAFDRLRLAEASDESNREHALRALDFAVSGAKDAFDQLQKSILGVGQVDRIAKFSDMILNRARQARSRRVLSVAT
jgi:hypothetical protein